jgi:lipopolysaccharide transport protein LptA
MTRWQARLRYGLALFGVGFALVVAFAIRERRAPAAQADAGRTDPVAIAESVGGTSQLAKETRQDFSIDYGRMLAYQDGRVKFLEGVEVRVPQRTPAGRAFVLKASQGEARQDQTVVAVEGDVELTASDGLTARTAKATYESADEVVRVPGQVTFSRKRMTGSSRGATFDRGRDVLWMLEQARINIAADDRGTGKVDMDAGTAGFARRDRYLRFERSLRLVRERQVVEADTAMAYLQPDEDVLNMIELRGSARVAASTSAPGQVQSMSARDINLHYTEDGETLERATLAGDAAVQFAGANAQAGRRLSAQWMDITFTPDGSPSIVAARERVELALPAVGQTPARRIRAESLEATGEEGRGITTARFLDQVEFRETPVAAANAAPQERRIRARSLDAVVEPGFGGIDAAVFGGGVRFGDGTMDASAPDATYNVVKASMALVAGAAGPGAQMADQRATIEARRIDVALDGHSLTAEGDVRSVLKSSGRDASAGRDVRRPGMLKADQPVNVTSTRLTYDSASGRATYTGEPRLWQGETAIQGDTLILDDTLGNLTATGSVRSAWRLVDTDPKTGKAETKTTVATGDSLTYDDEQRRATYTTAARMNGPEGDLRADRIELYLVRDGDRLERVEAYDAVTLTSEARVFTGVRLSYYAADERYLMSGSPVRVLEQFPQECRETLGKTLTFFRATDSISVDGNDERRTQTTSGGKCPEPRTD